MLAIFLLISFLASIVGSICGIGGGIFIKPIFEAFNLMGIVEINFLSGSMVLAMSAVNSFRSLKTANELELKLTVPLALGAVVGGITGKTIFSQAALLFSSSVILSLIQSTLVLLMAIFSLAYTFNKDKIETRRIEKTGFCLFIGLFLGFLSAFLGIGGGPINLVALSYFFSMDDKKAASNSLLIILLSQAASLSQIMISGSIPPVSMAQLWIMVIGGILGGQAGFQIKKRMDGQAVRKGFTGVMIFLILMSLYGIGAGLYTIFGA